MEEINVNLGRRTFFIAGGIAAAAATGLPALADDTAKSDTSKGDTAKSAAAKSDSAKANIKVVTDFIKSWSDPDKLGDYLADDCSVLMEEGKPTVSGPAAVVSAFKGFLSGGAKLSVKTLSITDKGPVVITSRVDTLTNPGKPPQPFPVIGIFVVRNGKITYWSDYLNN